MINSTSLTLSISLTMWVTRLASASFHLSLPEEDDSVVGSCVGGREGRRGKGKRGEEREMRKREGGGQGKGRKKTKE